MNVRYTDDDKKLWEQMYSSGLSSYEISRQLNVPKPSVYKHIKSCGISRNWSEWQVGKEPWNKGVTGAQVAWNKGLTKHNDERVKKYGEKLKGNNYQNPWKERYFDTDYLYLVIVYLDGKMVYKVGRSFNKLANHTKNKLHSVIKIWKGIHYQVHHLEKFIHQKYQDYKIDFETTDSGYTECYVVELPITEIINLTEKTLKYYDYNYSTTIKETCMGN